MIKVSYSKQAIKALRRMPANAAGLIRQKIVAYAEDPASQATNVCKLRGRDGYRLRVGNWRVIFDRDGNVLEILEIGSRGGIYQ
ncbi:MAG: type II toxin-antitoxin system RelE/ParE family toxin [Magnetococcales bacterium]|nr:type II toxin-antitoxin system RelE/ParE family toxin [Magnetococcales bacterium]